MNGKDYLIVLLASLAPLLLTWWILQRTRAAYHGEPLPRYVLSDARKEGRRHNDRSVRVFIACPLLNKLLDGWVVDYSSSGLGILVTDSTIPALLELNRTWKLKFDFRFGEDDWVPVHIRNCTPEAHGWRLACELLDPIPNEIANTLARHC